MKDLDTYTQVYIHQRGLALLRLPDSLLAIRDPVNNSYHCGIVVVGDLEINMDLLEGSLNRKSYFPQRFRPGIQPKYDLRQVLASIKS